MLWMLVRPRPGSTISRVSTGHRVGLVAAYPTSVLDSRTLYGNGSLYQSVQGTGSSSLYGALGSSSLYGALCTGRRLPLL
eukprot:2400269-Rhodomonas_salina.1